MQQRVHTRLDSRVSITTFDNVETGWKSVRFNVNLPCIYRSVAVNWMETEITKAPAGEDNGGGGGVT